MAETDPTSVLCYTTPASDTGVVTFDDPEGLSRTPVVALAQDQRGYLWIGTERGTARFDGVEWAIPSGLIETRTLETFALDTSEPSTLCVGTNGAGLWFVDIAAVPYRRARAVTAADGLADADIHAMCRDSCGALWVGTHHGLAVVEGHDGARAGRCWTAQDGIPEAGICALCADPAGGVWAGSLHGLLRFDRGGPQRRLTSHDGLPDDTVYALCSDERGRVWAGTRNGIAILHEGTVVATLLDGLPAREIRALCTDGHNQMWAGTAKGLALIEDVRVHRCWTQAEHLPSSSIWSLLRDRQNRIWVGTEAGLALLPRQSVPARELALRGTAEGGAFAFATDHARRTWIGTADGLLAVDADAQREVTPPALPSVLAQAGAWAVCCDRAGRLWSGGRYGGLFCLHPATGATLAHIESVGAVRCLIDDADGHLWIGTLGAGLFCIDAESGHILHRVTVAGGLPSDHVSSLYLDGEGRLWVGTLGGGVAYLDRRLGRILGAVGLADGLPHPSISALAPATDAGCLWGTTQGGGLFRLHLATAGVDGVWTVADGLPTNTLLSCVVAPSGALWLGTARGLARFTPQTGSCITLGRPHGLPGEACLQGALMLDDLGRLWVGTVDGVAVIALADVPQALPPSDVFITGLRVMGHERELREGLVIEDTEYDLVIDFGAVAYVGAAKVLYRTQLVGLEGEWGTPHHYRFARYTNLRPGEYLFRVAARNAGGQWSTPAEWRFRVIQNRAAHELERAQHRAEAAEQAVKVRNEVLRAVAHDLRTPLTAVIGHADLLRTRLERQELPARDWLRAQAGALQSAARRIDGMVTQILDATHVQLGQQPALQQSPVDVGLMVQELVRALTAATPFEKSTRLDAPGGMIVSGDRARLERVVQNLIGNAMKYSPAATPIAVTVYGQGDEVCIRIEDGGVGIPPDELPHLFEPYYRASTAQGIPGTGLGLAGARGIVEQHGGRIALESVAGAGTTATVFLPIRDKAGLDKGWHHHPGG